MPTEPLPIFEESAPKQLGAPLWNLGFRPFFMGAAYFGALSIALWVWSYHYGIPVYPSGISPSLWHAHELLYGYALGVMAGFLLTATKSWTGQQTLHRAPLAGLFFLWLAASLFLFLGFFTAECFFNATGYQYVFATLLIPVLAIRAWWWFTPGILGKPMLLSLCGAYLAIVFGFILFALVPISSVTPLLAMHVLTIGGIGLITVSMMGRVSLGHSVRSIHEPPKALAYLFIGLAMAAVVRVAGPLFFVSAYQQWILLSAVLWVLCLLTFAVVCTPIWLRPGVDGQYC